MQQNILVCIKDCISIVYIAILDEQCRSKPLTQRSSSQLPDDSEIGLPVGNTNLPHDVLHLATM